MGDAGVSDDWNHVGSDLLLKNSVKQVATHFSQVKRKCCTLER